MGAADRRRRWGRLKAEWARSLHPGGGRGRVQRPNPAARTPALRRGHVGSTAACQMAPDGVAGVVSAKGPPARPTPALHTQSPTLPMRRIRGCPPRPTFRFCPRRLSPLPFCLPVCAWDSSRWPTAPCTSPARRSSTAAAFLSQEQPVAAAVVVQRACGHGVPGGPCGGSAAPDVEQPHQLHSLDSAEHFSHSQKGLPENFSTKEHDDDNDELTQIREGVNDFTVPSYRGPNPSVGEHNYEFRLYALDAFPKVPKRPGRDRLVEAMEGHILAKAVLVGHYNEDLYGTENVKGYHPTGVPQHSGPGRAQVKSQHNNTRVTPVAHQ